MNRVNRKTLLDLAQRGESEISDSTDTSQDPDLPNTAPAVINLQKQQMPSM